jgi:hypothetical protein
LKDDRALAALLLEVIWLSARRAQACHQASSRWPLVSSGRWGPASKHSSLAWPNGGRTRWRIDT